MNSVLLSCRFRSRLAVVMVMLAGILLGRVFTGGLGVQESYRASDGVFVVYFASADSMLLLAEYRIGEGTIEQRLEALQAGPTDRELHPVLPDDVQVLGRSLADGVLTVDFSSELRDGHAGGSAGERVTVYAIVNTLTMLTNVDQVQILIDGMVVETLAGHISLQAPLSQDLNLLGHHSL